MHIQAVVQLVLGFLLMLIGIIGVSLHHENPDDQQFAFDAAFIAVGAFVALWAAFGPRDLLSRELYQVFIGLAIIAVFLGVGFGIPGTPVDEAIAGLVVVALLLVYYIPQNVSLTEVLYYSRRRGSSGVDRFFAKYQNDLDLGFGRRSRRR